jgi:hypothetical protein
MLPKDDPDRYRMSQVGGLVGSAGMVYLEFMAFVEADPALMLKSLEGYQNELAPEKERLDAFYRQFRCKRCGSACRKETIRNHCFNDPGTLVPRAVLRCLNCKFLFDPHSGLAIEMGEGTSIIPTEDE